MSVETVPDGFPTIPILATAKGKELCAFLQQVFEANVLSSGSAGRNQDGTRHRMDEAGRPKSH